MRIAVDARFFQSNSAGNYFTKQLFHKLAQLHENNQFIFFFDKSINALHDATENITSVIITPAVTNFIFYKWWYDIKLPPALRKHKADVFIGTNGVVSLTSKIPQLLIIQNLSFLHYSVHYPASNVFFYKKFIAKFVKKAAAIITVSDLTKQEVINTYQISDENITAVGYAADNSFKPLNWTEKEKVKDKYARSCEYFIFNGGFHPAKNLINLLKAFSIFKKWQKTNMKLLITINSNEYKDEAEKLKSYKYKNEIILIQNLSAIEFARVTSGAYAMICPSLYEGFGLNVLESLQCEVPVITSANSIIAEIAGDAALYTDTAKPEEIAEQMKRIFKDEPLRNQLAAAGKERAQFYNFDKTIALVWQEIEKVVSR